jgi:hypothetical protein
MSTASVVKFICCQTLHPKQPFGGHQFTCEAVNDICVWNGTVLGSEGIHIRTQVPMKANCPYLSKLPVTVGTDMAPA